MATARQGGGRGAASSATRGAAGDGRAYTVSGIPVLLIAEAGSAGDAAEAAILLAGTRLLRRIGWSAVAETLPMLATWPVLVIEAGGVATATLEAGLPRIAAYLARAAVPAVVSFDEQQIDLVALHLLDVQAVMLCAPDAAQRVAALAAASATQVPQLHDSWREEGDRERLERLDQQVAHIADLLADLTRRESPVPRTIADRRRSYDGEPPATGGQAIAAHEVRRLIQLRNLRGKFFGQFIGEGLFEDPAWDMLLDLFAAELEGTRVSVSSLCIAAGVAPTTALRWIAKMTEMELFVRQPDPLDRRRAFMALSPRASEAMRGYMLAMRKVEAG
ncbi:MarR family winged helix-turn-helix transcriptional regulator [Sphingomonas sp. A2-49]|uniref:MarR family winged helix-turn-helix transcriptional regulator n=1 Tax=Sphingomonas sp. A2-49 TaxID=1391375 RepID=UPI0021CE9691|nr:MarR family winged helix-turn-helix transcriptional regulator [Sphingomonas sp. A2-49]MCU6455039.1 MarR family winged helix-turn-helix transcriptional regulator [Sphingomonas sp. A2-49]